MFRAKKAFTLIELLVVISIIALLVSILLPALNEARNRARLLKCLVNSRSVGTAFSGYAADFKDVLPPHFTNQGFSGGGSTTIGQSASLPLGTNFWAWFLGRPIRKDNVNFLVGQTLGNRAKPFGVRCLYETGAIDNFKIFYCPGHVSLPGSLERSFDPEFYTHPTTGEWVTPAEAGTASGSMSELIRISYWYAKPMVNNKTPGKMSKFSSKPIYFDILHSWIELSHKSSNGEPKGINVLYGDGHAETFNKMEFFDEDILITNVGYDPWNRTSQNTSDGPGNYVVRFLPLYLILQEMDPLSYDSSTYYMSYEVMGHFWK